MLATNSRSSAVIIKKCFQIEELKSFQQENIQIMDLNGPITISSIYCPQFQLKIVTL